MCTLTVIKSGDSVLITSNRDEKTQRPSLPPRHYVYNNKNVLFPMDVHSGGTWFALADGNTLGVLLNGGFFKHIPSPPYRKSRGLILLDIVCSNRPDLFIKEINLFNIEPFTVVLLYRERFFELVWDGHQKHIKILSEVENHIWSSVTLYPAEVRKMRQQWFDDFMALTPKPCANDVFKFHSFRHRDEEENGLVMNRGNVLKTLSITQAVVTKNKIELTHSDLEKQFQSESVVLVV